YGFGVFHIDTGPRRTWANNSWGSSKYGKSKYKKKRAAKRRRYARPRLPQAGGGVFRPRPAAQRPRGSFFRRINAATLRVGDRRTAPASTFGQGRRIWKSARFGSFAPAS